jgi:hypothetical protein
LIRFLFRFNVDGTIFGVMVYLIVMVHAVWRFECVWASATTVALVH